MGVFNRTQAYYDAVYHYKDYKSEAAALTETIERDRRSKGRDLLDVACGTGAHLAHLKKRYRCTGLDLDAGMLKVAKGRIPGVRLHRADMRGFDLGREFDVVVCLFGSIGFSNDVRGLDRTIAAFARHTKPGGVVVVEPWILRGKFGHGRTGIQMGEAEGVKVARAFRSAARGRVSKLHFHYLVAADGKVTSIRETQTLGLFSRGEYERAFRRAGLSVRFYKRGLTGRGLLVGLKPLGEHGTVKRRRAQRKTAK
jgi:SAM-dependent methyltransferase